MLAVNENFVPATNALADKGNAALQMAMRCGFKVRRGQVKQLDASSAQCRFIVTGFSAKINDGADGVDSGEIPRPFHREAGPESELIGQPMEVWSPFCSTKIIFFFNVRSIFFFFFSDDRFSQWFYCLIA